MRPARVLSFGSVPPEWGGAIRGGVATFHASLTSALVPGLRTEAEVVGAVLTRTPGDGTAPVPLRAAAPGQKRVDFLEEVLAELRPDVALLHHFANDWGDLLPRLAPELPLVGIAHSWHMITQAEDEEARALAHKRVGRTMRGLRTLIVGSAHCRDEGKALGLRYPSDLRVVHYGLQEAFTAPIDLDGPRDGVLFAASLTPRKNGAVVLEAVARLGDDTRLVVAGEGPEEEALRGQADELGLTERVVFDPGGGPDHVERLRARMAEAEVLCVPSQSESFGLVYIEALACGTPVVGFGGTVAEIGDTLGLAIGRPLDLPTPGAVAEAITEVRRQRWDRDLLRRTTLRAFAEGDVARRYAEALADAAGALAPEPSALAAEVERLGPWDHAIDLGPVTTPGTSSPATAARRSALEGALEHFGGALKGRRVLDVGCGAGEVTAGAAAAGALSVLGLERDPHRAAQARLVLAARRADPGRTAVRCADVLEADLEGLTYELVLCLGPLGASPRPVELVWKLAAATRRLLVVEAAVADGDDAGFRLLDGPPPALRPTRTALPALLRTCGLSVEELPAPPGRQVLRCLRRGPQPA